MIMKKLSDGNFILNHIFIGLQKVSYENVEKRPCAMMKGVESYLYIKTGEYMIKIPNTLLEIVGVSKEEAWERALEHVKEETKIESMRKKLKKIDCPADLEKADKENPMFILSNESGIRGASAILNKEVLEELAHRYETNKLVVIPSSVHELIVLPSSSEQELPILSKMVETVNATMVEEKDRLINEAVIIRL